jgi:hypothetical protein
MTVEDVDIILAGVVPALKEHVAEQIAGLTLAVNGLAAKIAEMENRPAPKDGASVTIVDVLPVLNEALGKVKGVSMDEVAADIRAVLGDVDERIRSTVDAAVAAIPKAEDGKDADPATVAKLIVEAISSMPKPADGKSVTVEDVRPLVESEVAKAVAAIPKPKDAEGVDLKEIVRLAAEDVDEGMENRVIVAVAAEVAKAVEALKIDAKIEAQVKHDVDEKVDEKVNWTDISDRIDEMVETAVKAAPQAKDGVGVTGALLDRTGRLVLTLSDGTSKDAGMVVDQAEVERFVAAQVAKWPVPKDGKDGAGFGDLDWVVDSEGRLHQRVTHGDAVKVSPPMNGVFRGVWRPEDSYLAGDSVNRDGSTWTAKAPSDHKQPGTMEGAASWQLSVKRGNDGKPGRKGDDGKPGKDLRLEDVKIIRGNPDGSTWR